MANQPVVSLNNAFGQTPITITVVEGVYTVDPQALPIADEVGILPTFDASKCSIYEARAAAFGYVLDYHQVNEGA